MANLASTATGLDIIAALRKRLEGNGHLLSDSEYTTLLIDIMTIINTDSGNVLAHATSEVGSNKQRPFQKGV